MATMDAIGIALSPFTMRSFLAVSEIHTSSPLISAPTMRFESRRQKW
jgi:hypothetical protein